MTDPTETIPARRGPMRRVLITGATGIGATQRRPSLSAPPCLRENQLQRSIACRGASVDCVFPNQHQLRSPGDVERSGEVSNGSPHLRR